jgi:hypothetical protein
MSTSQRSLSNMRNTTRIFAALFALGFSTIPVFGQAVSGKVTTAAPTYGNNTIAPLSLDTGGNLRINCVTGCGGGGGGNNVNIDAVGGNTVTTTVPVSGTVSATVSGTVGVSSLPALPAGSNAIGTVGVTSLPALPAGSNAIGTVGVTSLPALPAGSNTIGNVGLAEPATTNYSLIGAASTNATSVKASAGTLYEISLANISTTATAYLKLYNSASAPTCGSGTPVARYLIPFAASGGAGSNLSLTLGKTFTTGIAFCITAGIADNDTTAIAANTVIVNLTYK